MMVPCFEIVEDGKAITCRVCNLTSHHPKDVKNRYCGKCHVFHDIRTANEISTLANRTEPVRARVKGQTGWTDCGIVLASGNGRSVVLECDEGLPLRAAGINRTTGKMNVPLFFNPEKLAFEFLMTDEPYEIEI